MSAIERIRSLSRVKRRLVLAGSGIAALAAVGTVGLGGTSAIFTSQANSQSSSFTAGTVTLTNDASQSVTCTLGNLAPGTMGAYPVTSTKYGQNEATTVPDPTACQLKVDYSGSLRAWIFLDVKVTSTAANPQGGSTGTSALYDGSSNGLQLGVVGASAGSDSFTGIGQVFSLGGATCGEAGTTQTCTSTSSNQLVDFNNPVSSGASGVFNLDSYLPLWAGNAYQGSTATVTLTAHAVQYDNNHGSDCYSTPCFATSASGAPIGAPFVTSASVVGAMPATSTTAATPATVSLVFSQPLQDNVSLGPWTNLVVTDLSQGSAPNNTCPVVSASLGTTTATDDTLNLTLGTCTQGGSVSSGALLSVYYTSYYLGSHSVFLQGLATGSGTAPYVSTWNALVRAS